MDRWFVDSICSKCPNYWSVGTSLAKEGARIEVCVYQRTLAVTAMQVESTRDGIRVEDLRECPDRPRAARAKTGV